VPASQNFDMLMIFLPIQAWKTQKSNKLLEDSLPRCSYDQWHLNNLQTLRYSDCLRKAFLAELTGVELSPDCYYDSVTSGFACVTCNLFFTKLSRSVVLGSLCANGCGENEQGPDTICRLCAFINDAL
jgi:hypothetical protein